VKDCLFCKVARHDLPSKIEYEDDRVVAFHDIGPQAPTHLLIIPKKHLATLNEISEADADLFGHLILKASELARRLGHGDTGYRLVANCQADAGQSVFHVHFHILGGRRFTWPPG